jgi:hypothetical protein
MMLMTLIAGSVMLVPAVVWTTVVIVIARRIDDGPIGWPLDFAGWE